jgi:hypothetical protein
MLPTAFIVHQVERQRVRLKIPNRKGDAPFFTLLSDTLQKHLSGIRSTVNPLTGSVLVTGDPLKLTELSKLAESKKLFSLRMEGVPSVPLAEKVVAPIAGADGLVREITRGSLNLPETLFISLLAFGLFEVARGNFKTPPWYTAFWYAFGILTKSMVDRVAEDR